jgi:hypothetical protein
MYSLWKRQERSAVLAMRALHITVVFTTTQRPTKFTSAATSFAQRPAIKSKHPKCSWMVCFCPKLSLLAAGLTDLGVLGGILVKNKAEVSHFNGSVR